MADENLPCPACGFLTFQGTYGSYDICKMCGWEDDAVQLANPACGGGANAESLIEAQATATRRYPLGGELAKGTRRDPRWRPLSDSEKEVASRERDEEYWMNKGTIEPEQIYWLRGIVREESG